MHYLFVLILALSFFNLKAQDNKESQKVYYHYYNNGIADTSSVHTILYNDGIVYLSKPYDKIRYFMDYGNKQNVTILSYIDNLFATTYSFDSLPESVLKDDTETILGYKCSLASYKVFSNSIDVWYTEESSLQGSPYSRYIPNENALVLKVVINGNRTLIADSIITLSDNESYGFPIDSCVILTDPELEELKIKSRYETISVFKNETINFDPDHWTGNDFDSVSGVYHFSKGAVILKKVLLSESVNSGDEVYAKLTCWSAGDAYDRTGSVFAIVPNNSEISMLDALSDGLSILPLYYDNNGKKYQGIVATENYSPQIELMRFFTSFGVGHFNDLRIINNYPWKDAAIYNQDITTMFPADVDEIWVGVFIGNYDKGGHRVNLDLNIYPSFNGKVNGSKYIQPLFSTVNIMEMSSQEYGRLFDNDTLVVDFKIPDSINNLRLLYTSTGHGGWGGGDEFNPKLNQIFIDGKQIFSTIPWRTDCASFRLYNPASGNFGNGLSSSDLSRSNWCPATLTPPYYIELNNLSSGKHTIEVVIDQGEDEGGSFNHWGITGVLVGDIE